MNEDNIMILGGEVESRESSQSFSPPFAPAGHPAHNNMFVSSPNSKFDAFKTPSINTKILSTDNSP
jgi:hypothetical protein